jgi:hypothetical protein
MKAARLEIEATKYEELLTKKDAELNLAKKNLILYAETIKKLEEKLKDKYNEASKKIEEESYMDLDED